MSYYDIYRGSILLMKLLITNIADKNLGNCIEYFRDNFMHNPSTCLFYILHFTIKLY